ncbi:MAG: winged helix-turn-helix transcriptional regulator [Anaerolineaceae bacterium]|jgi:DNA-binding MarR family transcriptional regulator|nr:winged helix-turn-helix transcriptional regulator [Anaerolineaceae bacterium]
MTTYSENEHRELALLEHISVDPDATQATLASQLGVAVGTINWHLKRLIDKGYVKVRRAERRKLRYIITPEGIALRARLAIDYIQTSMSLYRLVRERSLKAIQQLRKAGFQEVHIVGEGEVAEICRLTCMEQNILMVDEGIETPIFRINELKIHVDFMEDQTK